MGIERIDDNGLIDTNNQKMIDAYRSNLRVLADEVLRSRKIDKFKIIREDNFFPYDSMWRVNSRDTYLEYAKSRIAFAIRSAVKEERIMKMKNIKIDKSLGFSIPIRLTEEEKNIIDASIDPLLGFVLEPVKFRSTKHFTINTPLEYTGSYNQVSSGRNFVVIDDIDNFCNSSYAYSVDYRDAYLDITHENLPISRNAIYLVSEEKYEELMNNPVMSGQLAGKRVIRYRGDLSTAINMVLAQEGVLPYHVGIRDMEYTPELDEIFVESMKNLAASIGVSYSQGHGNMFGKGGHFSDLLDKENNERCIFEREFTEYIKSAIPELKGVITNIYTEIDLAIRKVGYEPILKAIQDYNANHGKNMLKRIRTFDMTHTVDSQTHVLFVNTLKTIERLYQEDEVSVEMENLICAFFHSPSVEEKVAAADKINDLVSQDKKTP